MAMKRIKCFKNGRLVSDKPYVEGVFEHCVGMAKSNLSKITDLVVTNDTMTFIENGINCKMVIV